MENVILTIDISSNSVKVGLVSEFLTLKSLTNQKFKVVDEDIDGLARRFNMDELWNKVLTGIESTLYKHKSKEFNIIGVSSCAQRIATVFIDRKGDEIYGGPNTDVRGIDTEYIIEDKFSDEEIFEITGHSPSLLFCLARLLWFREEDENNYNRINKVLMLDDWLIYRLSGVFCTDLSSSSESQLIDIRKSEWSTEIIQTFDFNPDFFPKIVDSGSIIGELKPELKKRFNLETEIPIIKTGGDTQASLLGMGAIKEGDIGISLGTTSPLDLVINQPIIDQDHNLWTSCHVLKNKWLIEANAGNTGTAYDWFKDSFLKEKVDNVDNLFESYLKDTEPGDFSIFSYLGPEKMNIKNQTSIKRGIFIFPPPMMISEKHPHIEHFARSIIENIAFGIYENHQVLQKFIDFKTNTYCAGGMAKSNEFCKILANVLNTEIKTPNFEESSAIGIALNVLKTLKYTPNFKTIINNLVKFKSYYPVSPIVDKYKKIYNKWKAFKQKIDDL
ncbi:MAG: FGGY-family carbohydrate kinase [Candidatus Thorarchaeota archaeon]